jgi:hypothetical protein
VTEELIGAVEPQRLDLEAECVQPFRPRHGVLGAGDVSYAAVSERVQMGECKTHAIRMVGAHEDGAAAGAPDVDADERHVA